MVFAGWGKNGSRASLKKTQLWVPSDFPGALVQLLANGVLCSGPRAAVDVQVTAWWAPDGLLHRRVVGDALRPRLQGPGSWTGKLGLRPGCTVSHPLGVTDGTADERHRDSR